MIGTNLGVGRRFRTGVSRKPESHKLFQICFEFQTISPVTPGQRSAPPFGPRSRNTSSDAARSERNRSRTGPACRRRPSANAVRAPSWPRGVPTRPANPWSESNSPSLRDQDSSLILTLVGYIGVSLNGISMVNQRLMPQAPLGPTVLSKPINCDGLAGSTQNVKCCSPATAGAPTHFTQPSTV